MGGDGATGFCSGEYGFLSGGEELGELTRGLDWAASPIGTPDTWPQNLRTALRIMLTSRQPIWIGWGPELIYFYNDPYKTIIGGKHPWALGRPAREVWREIWDDIGPLLDTAMSGDQGTYVEAQLLIMERNGYPEETYYTFSYSPIPNDDGSIGGIICANTDDTQRVIGERQLALLRDLAADTTHARNWREACQRSVAALATNPRDLPFAMIYTAAQDGAFDLSGAAGIEPGHPAAPETIGVDDDALWPICEVLHTQEAKVVASPQMQNGAVLPSGPWRQPPQQCAVLPIPQTGETGRAGMLVVGLNRFRLFDDNYRGFLGLVAGQIAAAINNAQAYEEERRRAEALAEIDRAKTTFFSNVSHEFRTPLTLMLAPIEDALNDETVALPPAHRARLDTAHRNSLRLLKLVNSLLDFSRIEAGRAEARFEPVDLAGLTAELASNFESATERAGLLLRIDCPPLPQPVHVDRDMWEKIVLNLLSNAFKFTFAGDITVQVRPAAGKAAVELSVRDSGVGIPPHELPLLFERFHRVEGQQSRSYEGSGIGLALVQELVKLHGGTITVDSALERGTEFVVSLPLGNAHLPSERMGSSHARTETSLRADAYVEEALRWLPEADRASAEAPIDRAEDALDQAFGASTRGARIVVADDNADMRSYIGRLLSGRWDVETVADGAAALDAVRRRKPDLVLADVMMPRLDGFALLRELRADPALTDLPIILLSARAGEEARVEGLEAGADDYLTKPFTARELVARVASNLELARVRERAADALRGEAVRLEILNRIATRMASETELEPLVQAVTDAATELTGAQYGAFFYNIIDREGQSYLLYTLSGATLKDFEGFPQPRNTAVFAPTFNGEGVVRSGDIRKDPRYGHNTPHHGPPAGHLPVVSYLAVPVIAPSGEVLGGLFFAHGEPDRFTDRHELIVSGIASQAAVAFEKTRLYDGTRKAEAELRRLNETLEQRVANEVSERLKTEEALRQAQKMEAIGKLTGGVAHDFNNVLQVIGGNLQLLTQDVSGNLRGEQRLQTAISAISRGSKLASQLLAFGRRQPLAPKSVNLGQLIRGIDDILRRALGEGIEIETVVAGGLWNTFVDVVQVENALLNLAINSRDAMEGHGRLTIEAGNAFLDDAYAARHADVEAGQYVMLAISDTGCGIAPEIIDQVFEPFFTTKPEGQGTGLGLSMVYGFVKQSSGHVKIYSEPGFGTTVRLYLPRTQQPADIEIDIQSGPATGGTETVLVVEDDDDVRTTVVDMLSDLGYRVLRARDAQSALAIVESGVPIDLLFTDVVMPGALRSPELARRARERLPSIAVLFTSGYTENAIVHGGRLDAGVDLLSKPYSRETLARKIRHVLRNQQQRNEARTASPARLRSQPRATTPASRLRILLVEDDALIRETTADMLGILGHSVAVAANGTEALALLDEGAFDVLLTDLALPGIAGDELALRAVNQQPGLRVVVATGYDALPASIEGKFPVSLLRKPYNQAKLADALKSATEAATK